MVQLSPSPTPDVSPPPECSEDGDKRQESLKAGGPKMDSPGGQAPLQLNLDVSTAYHGYETYIEDGLICLKHKVRNLEKKKLKLEDYMKRLKEGETLNKDQMEAVDKYQEVLHNITFARELHKTLDGLTQNLLRAQKRVAKRDQMEKMEAERRRLGTVLQIQHLLHSLEQEHIRKDLLAGHNSAPHVPAQQLQNLIQLAALVGVKRDNRLSLEEQMEKSAVVYLDLLEGKDKPVAGSTFKLLKEELARLLDCEYFNCLPAPPSKTPEDFLNSTHSTLSKLSDVSKKEFFNRLYITDTETRSTENWKADFQAMKEREPPDSWEMELADGLDSSKTPVHKPWRGVAAFIPKLPTTAKKQSAKTKQSKEKKAKGEQRVKSTSHMDAAVEIFNFPSALPSDPILRKQHLEDLMTKIHGSFNFMQDSLLDGERSPTNGHQRLGRRSSGSPSPLATRRESMTSPVDLLPKAMHSTPLPTRLMERKASLTNGEPGLAICDLPLASEDPHEPLQLSDNEAFPSPPLYCRESTISGSLEDKNRPPTPVTESGKQSPCNGMVPPCTSPPPQEQTFTTPPTRRPLTSTTFQNMHSVFKVNAPLPQNGELKFKADTAEIRFSTTSTQTPPEFAPSEDEQQPAYQSDYTVGNGGQIFLSPGHSGGGSGRSGQSYYTRGSVRGGAFISQSPLRDTSPLLYGTREPGYQHGYRHGGVRHGSSAGWSDSSQVSSPDRDGSFTIVDSGQGDSLSVSTLEVSVAPHGHQHATLLPMQLYPMSHTLRVAFTASRTANFAPGNLDQPIVFDQLHSNLGDMYDTHIGRFTCPANGTYVFIFHILKLAVNVPLYINLMRNEDVMVSAYANDGAPDHETASNHAILPLYQGDQVWLRLHRGAIYGSTWKYSTFSGFLLYQD
ncbi:caprin-2 isoform X2 [Lampris incognitus]|uniref:caprin-2 isoform X2 n=1 Tax=Lampris incognitus TaxID=2546036 RepID=UPI0024B57136|nr:caprin-2 isoform X2 [Lampris incognitus]